MPERAEKILVVRTYAPNIAQQLALQTIADAAFGNDFFRTDGLHPLPSEFLMAYHGETMTGFLCIHRLDREGLNRFFPKVTPILAPFSDEAAVVACLRTIAVHKNFRRKGIAHLMVEVAMRNFAHDVQQVFSLCWRDTQGHSAFERILQRKGFGELAYFNDYWHLDSLQRGYQCAVCGVPPCRCGAVVMSKYNATKAIAPLPSG